MGKELHSNLIGKISALLNEARNKVVSTVNQTMVLAYFEIGRMIVEEEQNGKKRADYGKQLLKSLSVRLVAEFGKGFSVENLDRMRYFYKTYASRISSTALTKSSKTQSLSAKFKNGQAVSDVFKLSWSHYLKLMRINDENERKFYEIEAYKNNWSLRELQRQYDTALYTRLALSRNKKQVLELAEKGQIIEMPKDTIKDPYILEFLGLPEQSAYSESELEQKLIDKLEHFLLELGNGFTFVARQKRITIDEKHFKID